MNPAVAVFIGGGLGSLARYWINNLVISLGLFSFPFGTLFSNVLSSLLLGIFLGFSYMKSDYENTLRFFIAVGFCGGFNTFSTFSAETYELFKHGSFLIAVINVITNILLCIVMTASGIWIGKSV